MFNFVSSQKLLNLLVLSIAVSILLSLSLPAVAEVNSPTMTVLNMEEMSQIAGGTCKVVKSTMGGDVGRCESSGTKCSGGLQCGTNPYTIIYCSDYCESVISGGYYECYCDDRRPAWQSYNCQKCWLFWCNSARGRKGGVRWDCQTGAYCPGNGG